MGQGHANLVLLRVSQNISNDSQLLRKQPNPVHQRSIALAMNFNLDYQFILNGKDLTSMFYLSVYLSIFWNFSGGFEMDWDNLICWFQPLNTTLLLSYTICDTFDRES